MKVRALASVVAGLRRRVVRFARTAIGLRNGGLFNERLLGSYSAGFVLGYAALLLHGILRGGWILGSGGKLLTIDFCWIWTSGRFAASIDPARIYDAGIFQTLHDTLFRPGECVFSFAHQYVYPPTFLLFTYGLGLLPYLAAFIVWIFATLAVYEAATYAIMPRPAALIASLTPLPVIANIYLGHNGFLIAGLIGLSLVYLNGRPWLSGAILGLLTCKPQFGVLFPLALLASRNWRAFASATVSSLVLAVAATAAFGWHDWSAFVASLLNRTVELSPDAHISLNLQSVYGLLRWVGADPTSALIAQLIATALIALVTCVIWAKSVPHDVKAATLCASSLIASPYVLPYDLCILSIAAAFLVKDGLASGFLRGERTVMLTCFFGLLPMLVWVPTGPIISGLFLCLAIRRAARSKSARPRITQAISEPVAAGGFSA